MAAAASIPSSEVPARRARRRSARVAASSALAGALLLSACMTNNQAKTLGYMNTDRNHNGRRSLGALTQSVNKAQAWANYLASVGYLEHTNLPTSYTVRWCALGENVGYGPDTATVEAAFMNSPEHRANILGGQWNYAGTGVARRGNEVFVVQEFIETC